METDSTGPKEIRAGVAKVEITDTHVGVVNDSLYVKALILKNLATTAAIITVDAVAIENIGRIGDGYLNKVRSQLQQDLHIKPEHVLVNASHCHGLVCPDVVERTVRAVKEASQNLVPVKIGAGRGHEDRIMENRRLKLNNGKEADVRHAYALPPDENVAGIGPVDPEIGILRLDREDGRTLAVVYHFAVHPIQGVPNRGNTADIAGFASQVIEDNLGEGAVALFLQGCGGDINPTLYKDVNNPRDAEPLGSMLGLSTLKAIKTIRTRESRDLKVINETLALPRADHAPRIVLMEAEQERLLNSLTGASLNLKSFIPLFVKYSISPDYPSYYAHRYLREETTGKVGLKKLDEENRMNMDRYVHNIHVMEELTQVRLNLDALRKHHARNLAAGAKTIDVEVVGLRIGNFVLVAFPGELSAQTGLDIKQKSPHDYTFVAGVTNGYIYYTPTAEQFANARASGAQEDTDCLVAPEWQALFEDKVADILQKL